jgi:hypothetical protein
VTATATKNFDTFDGASALTLVNKVNDDDFMGAAAGTLLLTSMDATQQFEDDEEFWAVTVTFEFNPDSWNPTKILDRGMRKLDNGEWKPILVENREITEPALLDGHGAPLDPAAAPVYLEYDFYDEADFDTIGL